MATLVTDLDLNAPPREALSLDGRNGVRAVVWKNGRPIGQIAFRASDPVSPDRLLTEARLQLREAVGASAEDPEPTDQLPTVTVAVCTRDRVDDLSRCLESLRAQDAPPPNEILVVDNAPPDDRTREFVHRLGGIRYVEEVLPGLSFARNRALDEARGDVIAFLDDDAIATPGWLRAVGRLFAREPEVAVCSGPVAPAELETRAQELFERRGGFIQTFQRRTYGSSAPDDSAAPHWPLLAGALGTGCNLAIRRDVARALGGFDEALGAGTPAAGGEDHDMIFRVVEAGHLFAYEPEILVKHRHRADMSGLARQLEGWGRGTVAFLVKSRRSHPEFRRAAASAIFWLLRHHARRLAEALRRSPSEGLPPSLVLAELLGCFRGTVAYSASQRYVRRRREAGDGGVRAGANVADDVQHSASG